jgi:hypothetical protein
MKMTDLIKGSLKTIVLFNSIMICMIIRCFTVSGQDTISIAEERNNDASIEAIVSHKDKDVVISRINIPDIGSRSYFIKIYRMDSGKLKSYPFGTSAADDYDRATYKWVNDTTVVFKLINSSNSKSESFRMSGNGNRASLERM